jgi:hypothetical protein
MKHILFAVAVSILPLSPAGLLGAESGAGAPVAAADVTITVTYTGKGTVDSSHQLYVWLFSSPDIGPGSMPIAQVALDKNDTVAKFEGVMADRVWVAAAFDEKGAMTGNEPPPSGTPVGIYLGSDGAPKAVAAGETAKFSFDDSFRMP